MRYDRLIGMVGVLVTIMLALGALFQLGQSLFDHGGIIVALALVLTVVVISARIGIRGRDTVSTPYW